MAVDLMNSSTNTLLHTKMEQINVQEAATAGLQSVENLIRILSTQQSKFNDTTSSSTLTATPATDYAAVADVAVNKFKKFISLLDRNRTGHARFRRGPAPIKQNKNTLFSLTPPALEHQKEKVYSPAPIQQRMPPVSLVKSGSFDRKDFPVTTINFASSKANSFMSSLTGDSESLQPSMSSSGFQITNMSQVSMSGGQSNMSNSSFKRKCNSMDDSHTKCANSSGRCHCSKKR